MSDRKTGRESRFYPESEVSERQHPYKTYLFFAIVGSSILFLSLLFMYIIWLSHNPLNVHFRMPKSFIVSTIVLLLSSFAISNCVKAYRDDETKKLLISLSLGFFTGVIFSVLQVFGWMSMYKNGYFIDGEMGFAFIYIISGLHFLHVSIGLFYLLYLNFKAYDNWNDPVKALLYFSNKYERTRLEVFSTYWHFVDILWLVLFFIFLFTL